MSGKDWHALDIPTTVSALGTDIGRGLSGAEAASRLGTYGPNELAEEERKTLWAMFLDQFKDFLIMILVGASIVSAAVGEVTDSVVIIAIVVLNAIIGVVQEAKAERALEALKRMAASTAHVLRDGRVTEIPARELVPGDLVLLRTGDFVPADVRLVEAVNLRVEEAALTGESVPVEKDALAVVSRQSSLGDRLNLAFMGTLVTYGRGRGVVVATGMKTEMGLIATMIEEYIEEKTPLQKKLEALGKLLGTVCLGVCGIVFVAGLLRGEALLEMFMTAVSLAVAAIPEGLPAVVTIVLAIGMRRMIERHAIIRKLSAVETLGCTTVICSDKTGTLTQNEMTAVKAYAGGKWFDIEGEGYRPVGRFLREDGAVDPLADPDLHLLLRAGVLVNDATLERTEQVHQDWYIVGDPTEGALVVAAAKAGLTREMLHQDYPRVQEIPFDSERKRMTTIHASRGGGSPVAYVKGAPDVVLELCSRQSVGGTQKPLTEEGRRRILEANHAMSSLALRVLGVAYRPLGQVPAKPAPDDVEKDLVFVGLIGMIDPPRPEAVRAVELCRRAGIKPVMITGDYRETAIAIARKLGLLREGTRVVTGAELEAVSPAALAQAVEDIDVYARVSPIHKVKIVEALKQRGHVVAMTGDGVNDAPALKRADIGVAMGITGTDVTKEAADMVLTDDNFASIVSAVEEGRIIFGNIRKFVFYLLSCNVAEILVIFLAMMVGLPVPLRPIQLLWVNLVTDAFPALALGVEKGDPDVMDVPPRNPKEHIVDRGMRRAIAVNSAALTAATLASFVWALSRFGGDVLAARCVAFTTLVTAELLRAYTSRSERFSIFSLGIFSNLYMVAGTLTSFLLLLLVLYVPALQGVFDTIPLDVSTWVVVGLLSLVPFLAAELGKAVFGLRRR